MDNILIKLKKSIKKNIRGFSKIIPLLFGVILLINLLKVVFSNNFYSKIITNNIIIDSFLVNILGSIMAGNAIISYEIGKDMLISGLGIFLVTIFMLAWVTVGIAQLPAESILLGKKFSLVRNILNFIFNIIISILLILLMRIL